MFKDRNKFRVRECDGLALLINRRERFEERVWVKRWAHIGLTPQREDNIVQLAHQKRRNGTSVPNVETINSVVELVGIRLEVPVIPEDASVC